MNTKQLRQKILDLAIHGKLVPQDPNDEPASVLLERVRAEKERLIKDGKIKRDKNDSTIVRGDDKSHYGQLPLGWEWATLGSMGFYKKGPFGSSITKSMFVPESENAIKVYEQKNAIYKDDSLGSYFITEEKFQELKGFEAFPEDIIVSCAGTIGETYVMPTNIRRGIINQALMRIMLYDRHMTEYYLLYFDFILKENAQKASKGTAIKNIPPFDILKQFLMPIPPMEEQHRIIQAVKSFNVVIDEIENNRNDIRTAVAAAKSKILSLAIHGKLVPQDPADEPASVLLERIRAEREALVKAGKIKRGKSDSVVGRGDDNSYYAGLPKSWEVCQLGEIVRLVGGVSYDKNDVTTSGIRILRGGNIQNDKIYLFEDDVFLPSKYYDKEKVICVDDTVIVASTGSKTVIGKAGFITANMRDVQIGAFLRIIRPFFNDTSGFIQMLFRSDYYRNYIRDISKGTNINNVKAEYITEFIVALPSLAEQRRIVAAIEVAFKQLDEIAATFA